MAAESAILDRIVEDGEIDLLPGDVIEAFLHQRFKAALETVDITPLFEATVGHDRFG